MDQPALHLCSITKTLTKQYFSFVHTTFSIIETLALYFSDHL